uniref:Uncharacterized protein n=1 Tax=viral metagenome TaxID=1070528 RepID=A0A6M3K0R0_9ZZZZ
METPAKYNNGQDPRESSMMGDVAIIQRLDRIADSMERLETHLRIFLECIMVSNGFSEIDRLPQSDTERGLLWQMERRAEGMEANRKKKRRYRDAAAKRGNER